MRPLQPEQVWYTIKQLSLKAPGLDGIGFDFLKALPFQAMSDLIQIFHQIEAQAAIPQQWTTSLIALLPKSAEIERPIALVATVPSVVQIEKLTHQAVAAGHPRRTQHGSEESRAQSACRSHDRAS